MTLINVSPAANTHWTRPSPAPCSAAATRFWRQTPNLSWQLVHFSDHVARPDTSTYWHRGAWQSPLRRRLFTDGSALPSGPAGWGVLITYPDRADTNALWGL